MDWDNYGVEELSNNEGSKILNLDDELRLYVPAGSKRRITMAFA